ncbi:hypothetical protein [Salinibacillus kushneri]|nr:hypothetical protein [Salinibacillus kushneri]
MTLSDVDLYQRVRYGEEDISLKEVKQLKEDLDAKRQQLKSRVKEEEGD